MNLGIHIFGATSATAIGAARPRIKRAELLQDVRVALVTDAHILLDDRDAAAADVLEMILNELPDVFPIGRALELVQLREKAVLDVRGAAAGRIELGDLFEDPADLNVIFAG